MGFKEVLDSGLGLVALFIIGGGLIVTQAASFAAANWTGIGVSASIVSGLILIMIIYWLFSHAKANVKRN
jgi:hypothetical protein